MQWNINGIFLLLLKGSLVSMIDELLHYYQTKDRKILITTDLQINNKNLHGVVVKILSWLRLEHKRTLWMAEGRKTCLKSLDINIQYPWCADLSTLVNKEKLFHDSFSIKDGKFDFSDEVSEEDRKVAREKVYRNYIPTKHVLYRDMSAFPQCETCINYIKGNDT